MEDNEFILETVEEEYSAALCHPESHESLAACEGGWSDGTAFFPLIGGIGCFLPAAEHRLRRQSCGDMLKALADLSRWTLALCSGRDLLGERRALLDGLASQEERRVLELSPGTGLDIQALPEDLDFYGVDADPSKLQRSRHNLSRSGRTARLFCADASHLPFLDESFDAVLHGGDLRLSPEPCRVLDEMIRVARPGSVVSVIDRADPNIKPRLWVPAAMSEIELVFSPSNTLYRLSFRRP